MSAAMLLTGSVALGLGYSHTKNDNKMPANTGKLNTNIPLTCQMDTIVVNADNFEQMQHHAAAGVFIPGQNKVVVYYFLAACDDKRINNYCTRNNNQIPLTRRHEMEHARKAALTKITDDYPAHVRGQIAAMNEIMAPAAEIIEAVDHKYRTGCPFPAAKDFIRQADTEITQLADSLKMTWPINFNHPQIADIVIKYALVRFAGEFNRGTYRTTIRREITRPQNINYKPNSECDMLGYFMFWPTCGLWGPMWEFETMAGRANLWDAASESQKRFLLNQVDSFVAAVGGNTGQNSMFFTNGKTQ